MKLGSKSHYGFLALVELANNYKDRRTTQVKEIAKDQVLTAKVLKLVNSGFYGFSRPISTISHAVTMLPAAFASIV